MTLEEIDDTNCKVMEKVFGTWLTGVLIQAKKEHRLVAGMYEAAQCLEMNAENILACILPQNHLDDAGVHINQILLEAFCYENDVHILKVNSDEVLASIVAETSTVDSNKPHLPATSQNVGCVLLQTMKGRRPSRNEQHLIETHQTTGNSPFIIELPVP